MAKISINKLLSDRDELIVDYEHYSKLIVVREEYHKKLLSEWEHYFSNTLNFDERSVNVSKIEIKESEEELSNFKFMLKEILNKIIIVESKLNQNTKAKSLGFHPLFLNDNFKIEEDEFTKHLSSFLGNSGCDIENFFIVNKSKIKEIKHTLDLIEKTETRLKNFENDLDEQLKPFGSDLVFDRFISELKNNFKHDINREKGLLKHQIEKRTLLWSNLLELIKEQQ